MKPIPQLASKTTSARESHDVGYDSTAHFQSFKRQNPMSGAMKGLRIAVLAGLGAAVFPSDSTTIRGKAVSGLMGLLVPIGYQHHQPLDPRAFSTFASVGKNPAERAKNLGQNPNSVEYHNAIHDLVIDIQEQFQKLPPEQRNNTYMTHWSENHNHSALAVGTVTVSEDVARKIKYDQSLVLARLKAIPVGATFLVGEHAKAVKGFTHPAERTRYVWKNNAQIRQDEADYLAKGGDLKGCYVSLGKSGIVALDSCKVTEYGDLVVITVLAMTISRHALDGVNTWGIVIHKKKPTEILLFNHMEGAGTLRLSDQANCWGGEVLMMRAFTDFPLHLEAIQSGKTVDEVVKTRSADFQTKWRESLTFFTLFDVAGMFLATARAATGGNMEYDKYDTRDLVYENDAAMLRDIGDNTVDQLVHADGPGIKRTNLPPGFILGGVRLDPVLAITPGNSVEVSAMMVAGDFKTEQVDMVRKYVPNKLGLLMAAEDVKADFRKAMADLIKDKADAVVKSLQPGVAPPSPHDLMAMIRRDLDFITQARKIVHDHLVARFMDQLEAEMTEMLGRRHQADVLALYSSACTLEVHDRLMADDGVVHTYMKAELVGQAARHLSVGQCLELIAQMETQRKKISDAVETGRKARDRLDPKKCDGVRGVGEEGSRGEGARARAGGVE
jgi:hypothetical protein